MDCRACLMNDGYKTKECNNCEERIEQANSISVTCEMINNEKEMSWTNGDYQIV